MDTTTALVANPERGEVLLTLDGAPRVVRFGLKFLKTLTDQAGEDGPADVLQRLATAPLASLLEMAGTGIRLAVPQLPADFDMLGALDELTNAEQQALFSVMLRSVTESPIFAALKAMGAAKE